MFHIKGPGTLFLSASRSCGLSQRDNSPLGYEDLQDYGSENGAAGTGTVEWRVPLADIGAIDGSFVSVSVHMLDMDEDGEPIYPISDVTEGNVQLSQ